MDKIAPTAPALPAFALALKTYRQKHNLTQRQAAERLGVKPRTWENWEYGTEPRESLRALTLRAIEAEPPRKARRRHA